jgi:hypothetical protein
MNVEDIGHNGEVLVIGVEADVFLVGYGADKDVIPRDREPSGSELCEIPGSLAPDFLIVLTVLDRSHSVSRRRGIPFPRDHKEPPRRHRGGL